MKKSMYLFILFIFISLGCECAFNIQHVKDESLSNSSGEESDEGFSSSPNDRPVSRTSGVAPLAVHFFADFVGSADGDERIERFHHYDYTWNFDDAGSGNWGTTGKSKNTVKGAAAVHVYENPGIYNVSLIIRNHSGVVGTESYSITVNDPDSFYSGTNTTCVNNAGDTDFSDAPSGARTESTDDLSTITQYATTGSRILFKRGSSWIVSSSLNWPGNSGPVTIGAYGGTTTGTRDAQGIYDNAPQITVNGGTFLNLALKQGWTIMDLHLIDTTRSNYCFGGATSMQRLLFLRLEITGFNTGIGWSHWNDADCMRKDDMVISSCNISESKIHIIYGGSERLALIGNILCDVQEYHVVRIWQAYRSVISNNIISGSSLSTDTGMLGLKFHGPGVYPGGEGTDSFGVPVPETGLLNVRTEFSIIADNIFGSSGPWPVVIAPQNGAADERLSNIIFERNRFHSDYGSQSSREVTVSLGVCARYTTIRNNIFDGTGSDNTYTGIAVERRGVEPAPKNIEIYHNTIYRGDSPSYIHRGITLREPVTNSIVQNNLISFPYVTGSVTMILDETTDSVCLNNLLTDDAQFILPDASSPLNRDFRLQVSSPAIDQGSMVSVYDDFYINSRPESSSDLGAFEQ
ncbi:MAG TPA: PKD domain-containing protein [Spirochaetota bacterium]|nr:PKD domain-containing protein [Spirochaetota bacterium]HPR49828.1 PKD domain-containing protein [Spirochaetota bacterium]